jgi:uncharacterized protein YqcC (DUF446 family)
LGGWFGTLLSYPNPLFFDELEGCAEEWLQWILSAVLVNI